MAGNVNSTGDYWKAMGIGGLAGLAGYGAGSLVSGVVGSIGVIGGGLSGAAGGAAGGFVGTAGNAWSFQNANFGQGLKSGLTGAGYGALGGAVIGGIVGGVVAYKHRGDVWTGEGAIFESMATGVIDPSKPVVIGEGMEYSNKYARDFSDAHFSEEIKGLENLYADGTMPTGYRNVGDYVQKPNGKGYIDGVTIYQGIGKGSNVYLAKSAFEFPAKLYTVMGHEYIHVGFNSLGKMDHNKQEAVAYKWSRQQVESFGYKSQTYIDGEKFYAPYNKNFYPANVYKIGNIDVTYFNRYSLQPKWYLLNLNK
jgi:hypothetical protein